MLCKGEYKVGRLTRKMNWGYACIKNADEFDGNELINANQKLGQLEDILDNYDLESAEDLDIELKGNREKVYKYEILEKKLGIDLITLFKALKQGIYTKDNMDFIPYSCLLRNDFILVLFDDIYKHEYLLKDYGKTWALTKEELEK